MMLSQMGCSASIMHLMLIPMCPTLFLGLLKHLILSLELLLFILNLGLWKWDKWELLMEKSNSYISCFRWPSILTPIAIIVVLMKQLNKTLFESSVPRCSRTVYGTQYCTKFRMIQIILMKNTEGLSSKRKTQKQIPFADNTFFFYMVATFGDAPFLCWLPLRGDSFFCINAACIMLNLGEPLPNIMVVLFHWMHWKQNYIWLFINII